MEQERRKAANLKNSQASRGVKRVRKDRVNSTSQTKESYGDKSSYGSNTRTSNSTSSNHKTTKSGRIKTPLSRKMINKGYETTIVRIVDNIEDCYKLDADSNIEGYKTLKELPISLLHETIYPAVSRMSASARRSRNISASGYVASLVYINSLMQFNEEYRIDFDSYPAVSNLIGILSRFTTKTACKSLSPKYINNVIEALQLYESISLMRINWTASYKLLRLFYILIIYNNIVDASMVANLLCYQLKFILRYNNSKMTNNSKGTKSSSKVGGNQNVRGYNKTRRYAEQDRGHQYTGV